jgi:hypothetical protein
VNLNVNFNILKQFKCALVGRIKDMVTLYIICSVKPRPKWQRGGL